MTRLLFVDDDPELRLVMASVMRLAGYEVRTASDGLDAMRLMHLDPPDVVISDLGMPRMDGWELLAITRAHPATARLPFIIMSAVQGLKDLAVARGADGFLAKPFSPQDAHDEIESILGRGGSNKST